MVYDKICSECLKPFRTQSSVKITCSKECLDIRTMKLQQIRREEKRKYHLETKTCPYCGDEYQTERDALTCGKKKCLNIRAREKSKEAYYSMTPEERSGLAYSRKSRLANWKKPKTTVMLKCLKCGETKEYEVDVAWLGPKYRTCDDCRNALGSYYFSRGMDSTEYPIMA